MTLKWKDEYLCEPLLSEGTIINTGAIICNVILIAVVKAIAI